ncbi:MAG: N,N-dimethylformamidase beta subunit family domain-containing protein, partial [Syntrophothermus sp.]
MLIIIVFYLKPFYAIEGGYADKRSYTKGETANFYISTKNSNFEITIDKLTDILIFVQSIPNIKGFEQSSDDSSYYYGFNWLKTYSLKIPDNWTPGAYRISFPTSAGKKAFYIFVKEKVPGSYSDVLLILSDNTWAAYNPVGGKSLYEYNSTNGEKSTKVTFYRPPSAFLGETDFLRYESEFIKWMHNKNQKIEIVSEYDVHSSTSLLKNYKVIFIVGHSEYWSRLERLNIQNFVAAGGKLIILSGNTCFWQVRFEDNGKTLVCYKEALDDPLRTKADSLVTVRWYESPVNYPENPFTGVGFRSGGYVNNNENTLPQAQGYSDYAAYNTYHWIYEGTNIQEGEEFGYDYNIVGGEIDGAKFDWDNGVPVVNGSDFSPLNFKVLGISPAKPVDSEVL